MYKKKQDFTNNFSKVQSNFFVTMMQPKAVKLADSYIKEEMKHLKYLIKNLENVSEWNFIVVGSANLWHLDLVDSTNKSYIAIEPLADQFIGKERDTLFTKLPNIQIIAAKFGEFDKSLIPNVKNVFVFHFNVLEYIPHYIRKINKYLNAGDILYLSTWNNTKFAEETKQRYFDYINRKVNGSELRRSPYRMTKKCDFDYFPFHQLNHYIEHKRITESVVDILIIYC